MKFKTSFSLLFSLLILSSCHKPFFEPEILTDGYFSYIVVNERFVRYYEDHISIAVVGISAKGEDQNVLYIPEEISGYPVEYISLRSPSTFMDSYHTFAPSESLEKLYIPGTVKSVEQFGDQIRKVDVFLLHEEYTEDLHKAIHGAAYHIGNERVFVHSNLYESLEGEKEACRPANVSYHLNYETEDKKTLYSLDNYSSGEALIAPEAPSRYNYDFDGWYKEAECINKWDFENDCYSDYEVKLYAKWLENF